MTLTFNLPTYEFFSQRIQIYKKKKNCLFIYFILFIYFFFFFWGGGGGGELGEVSWGGVRGRGRWMDRRTGPNQFAPSTSSKLGA